ncbi:MAG: hypothetical protein HC904_13865 [Blastochloris sp.]|nr:hypothetical protein [Blastochloris sp.]
MLAMGCGCLLLAKGWGAEEVSKVLPVFTERSEVLPLTLRSTEGDKVGRQIYECERALQRMGSLLGWPASPELRYVVTWVGQGQETWWLDSYPLQVNREDGAWVFRFRGEGNWEKAQEQIYRTLAVALLQGRMLLQHKELPGPTFPDPPLWLSEGLTQSLMTSRRESFNLAVWRYALNKKAPSCGRSRPGRNWPRRGCAGVGSRVLPIGCCAKPRKVRRIKKRCKILLTVIWRSPGGATGAGT